MSDATKAAPATDAEVEAIRRHYANAPPLYPHGDQVNALLARLDAAERRVADLERALREEVARLRALVERVAAAYDGRADIWEVAAACAAALAGEGP